MSTRDKHRETDVVSWCHAAQYDRDRIQGDSRRAIGMNKVLGITPANAIFAVAFLGSFGSMLLIPRPEPIVLLCLMVLMIVWAIVIQWWIAAGLLIAVLVPTLGFPDRVFCMALGLFCGLLIETAIWARRKPARFWRDFFFPQ
jgi:hypothetical protein